MPTTISNTLFAVSLAAAFLGPDRAGAATPLGPSCLMVSSDGGSLFVGCYDTPRLLRVDLNSRQVSASLDLPAPATGLTLDTTGRRLYVTCAASQSTVVAVDTATWEVTRQGIAGHTATAPVVLGSQRRLVVCNRFDNGIGILDLETLHEFTRIPVVREPIAAALTGDETLLVVANHLPLEPADGYQVRSAVSLISTRDWSPRTIHLSHGSTGLRDIRISPDDRYAVVTHLVANFDLVASHLEEGWMNTNAVSVIDLLAGKLVGHVLLDDQYQGSANPWGLTFSADGQIMYVVHAGSHELSVLPTSEVIDKSPSKYEQRGPLGRPAYLEDCSRKIGIPGQGPRSVVMHGHRVLIGLYFFDAIAMLETPVGDAPQWTTIPLGPAPQPTLVRRGEMLFHDARLCFQHWQSCSSCHPDGRADGLNWDLLNDGAGNLKNTKSLLLAHQTPPAMVTAARDSAETAVRSGLKHILFAEPDEAAAEAIDAYLRSLKPVSSPRSADGKLSAAAARGRHWFREAGLGCVRCHPAPRFTDQRLHAIGSPDEIGLREFDTPTLVEVWRTAPYLHHGRYTTIRSLLTEGYHGVSPAGLRQLGDSGLDDLIEYVLSL